MFLEVPAFKILFIIYITLSVITFVACVTVPKAKIKKLLKCAILIPLITLYLLDITRLVSGYILYDTALKHGLYTNNVTVSQLIEGVHNTPEESTLPDDISNAVIIYYKFGCPDCENIYPELKKYLTDKKNVYFVSTRSEQGEKLLDEYPVEKVPSAIYVHTDGTFTKKSLYQTKDGKTIFLKDNLDRLFDLQAKIR